MNKHYHLIGIGGIGMSGIAHLLLRRGIQVSGSDLKESRITEGLIRAGARIFVGHSPRNIKGAQVVIYSSAIKEDNPEVIAAKKAKIPLIKRAEALAQLMREKDAVTVAGSHGKTTTASLASCLLLEAGFSPTVAVGGIVRSIDANACAGSGEFFVAEADESDGSFLNYRPRYSIVTNIDREHLDYYRDFASQLSAFKDFLNNTRQDGCVFYCADDKNLKSIAARLKNRHVSFGLGSAAIVHAQNMAFSGLSSGFDCYYRDKFVERFSLALGGRHNISNSLAVIALGLELGIDLKIIKKTLKEYQGSRRRLEVKFCSGGISVIDDYAHHPTEIKATLSAVKNLKHKRLIAIFQPHRYSRTRFLLPEFCESFDLLDCLILTDIYPAGEEPQEGITANRILEGIRRRSSSPKEVHLISKGELAGYALKIKREGDLILTLGAGDITRVCDELVEGLKKQQG